MIILDTSIIIDHLRQSLQTPTRLMELARIYHKENLAISILSIQELYEGRSTRDSKKEEYLLATVSPLKILSYTYEVAQMAGEIVRDMKEDITFVDAAIGATAVVYNATLCTFNKKNFSGIKNLLLRE